MQLPSTTILYIIRNNVARDVETLTITIRYHNLRSSWPTVRAHPWQKVKARRKTKRYAECDIVDQAPLTNLLIAFAYQRGTIGILRIRGSDNRNCQDSPFVEIGPGLPLNSRQDFRATSTTESVSLRSLREKKKRKKQRRDEEDEKEGGEDENPRVEFTIGSFARRRSRDSSLCFD